MLITYTDIIFLQTNICNLSPTVINQLVCKRRYLYLFVYWSVTCVSVGAIQAGKLNVVFSGISPVYTVINEVQG